MSHSQSRLLDFLNDLAAKRPTPGGGSASALGGALGAALGCMAANYTVGNEKHKDFQVAATAARDALEGLRAKFVALVDEDIAAYESYRAASALPKNSPDEKNARSQALAAALEQSTQVPERILSAAHAALKHVLALSAAVNPNLAGDVASAAYFLEACARGAAIQIQSNCAAADASGASARRRAAADETVSRCQQLREKIHVAVMQMLQRA